MNYWLDPRADLDDSPLWRDLLVRAYHHDIDVYGTLHGLRCLGARLERTAHGGVRLDRGRIEEADYTHLRTRYLVPVRAHLTELLSSVEAA